MERNACYPVEVNPPFDLVLEQSVGGERAETLGAVVFAADRLFISSNGHLACIDPRTRETLWEVQSTEGEPIALKACGSALYADFGGRVERLDADTGESERLAEPEEDLVAVLEQDVTVIGEDDDGQMQLICRAQASGEIRWSRALEFGFVSSITDASSRIILRSDQGLQCLDTASGEQIWVLTPGEWIERHAPEQMAAASYNQFSFQPGPVADGRFFLSLAGSVNAALDIESGEPVWVTAMPEGFAQAGTMILRDGTLYLNTQGRLGPTSRLCALDASNGELLAAQDEDFTPGGCANPIMLDKLFIGGREQTLAAFDIESREFVWRYVYPGKLRVFGGPLAPHANGFVVASREAGALLWFEARG